MSVVKWQHKFSAEAFRRRFLPWLLLFLLPSFIIDGLLIFNSFSGSIFTQNLVGSELLSLVAILLLNAVLLKSWALVWYFTLRSVYRKSGIFRQKGLWVYRRNLPNLSDTYLNYKPYVEYRLEDVRQVQRKRGGIVIAGQIEKRWLDEDGDVLQTRSVERVSIPGCFTDMDGLYCELMERISQYDT
jgi:hypothetical protein